MSKRKDKISNEVAAKRSRLEDSDDDNRRRTSMMSQAPDFNTSQTMSPEGEVGIIESVFLRNFMCHGKLDFKFGSHVNFIVGNNGSGKSAIAIGVLVGLGGKATAANRGNAVKNFIKDGKNMAEVAVRLRNRGPDAYKPELYGEAIIVERKLRIDGTGGYRLKDENGRVVSTKKEDLIAILDQFNIQVDNPIVILNQETSKTFLQTKSPTDLYKFFLKATHLEQTNAEYVSADESKAIAIGMMKRKEESLPELQKEVNLWKQKFEACAGLETLKDKITDLKKEMAWALISQRQKTLDPIAKELEIEQRRTPKFLQKVEETTENLKSKEEEHASIQEELKLLAGQTDELQPIYNESKEVLNDLKKKLRKAQDDLRKVTMETNAIIADKKQIEERIEELRQSDYSEYERERREREMRIALLESQLLESRSKLQTVDMDTDRFRSAYSAALNRQDSLKNEERAIASRIKQTEQRVRDLESSRSDKLRRFGAWVPDAIRMIDDAYNRKRFKEKPLGPIGAEISLKDPKWAVGVEACLGGLLQSFCVDNYNDEKVLEGIFVQACGGARKPAIITTKFRPTPYNVPANHTGFPTVKDMLTIENPVISNILVDQSSMERKLLISESGEARRFMRNSPPRDFGQAYTLSGDNLIAFPMFRSYASNKDRAQYLTANIEEVIRQHKDELKGEKEKVQQLKSSIREVGTEVDRNQQEQRKSELIMRKLRDSMSNINAELTQLKNIEDPAPADVSTLEEERDSLTVRLSDLEKQKQVVSKGVSTATELMKEKENYFQEIDQKIRNAAQKLNPYKDRLAVVQDEIGKAREHKKYYQTKMKEHEKKIEEVQAKYDATKADVVSDRAKALEICPEIKTQRSAQNIESEIKQIGLQIQAQEKIRGDFAQISKTYLEKKTRYEKLEREVYQINNFLQKLDDTMVLRKKWFEWLKNSLTARVKMYFLINLRKRKFNGKLNISHQNHTLEPIVIPKPADQESSDQTMSTKSLSGGERSYSTSCFILSLWDIMDSPFRILDEFDIFMDMVNRRIAMESLLDSTKQKSGCQFIILTPLDTSYVNAGMQDVKIYQMPTPDRQQPAIMNGDEVEENRG